ncbi:LamG-like jellyroll fold domain-containing protein [Flavobacterium terrisoli]|uniref:LamG-like jellyroll fold domain-containing protein n=1 Tax=Flavobacterium terrisoli TaxID=3242195 RepID=UPI002542ECA2|nr:LamG-like jellyroll fold domain-containing protein [Flavobacterium buctense]
MKNTVLNLHRNYFVLIALLITSITFGQDLFDSNGTVIWNATTNSGYNNSVRFIGRDDSISLNQKQNTTSNPYVGLGTIALSNAANTNTFGGDRRYLVWGDNGSSMNDSGTDATITFAGGTGVTTLVDLPNKVWKIVETGGDVTSTKLSLPTTDFSGLPALSGNDAYVLIVANDASFTSNVETVFLSVNGSRQEAIYDFDGTKFFTFGIAHQSTFSRHATLDGLDDVIKFDAVNNLTPNFTMMFWMRPTGQNGLATDRTIVSKYNGTTGYRVFLSANNKLNVTWTGASLTSTTVLPNNEWHNIAIISNTNSTKLYIDGVLDSSATTAAAAVNTNTFSLGAEYRSKSDIRNYFKGELDEFRLWNKTLNLSQLRFIINQEILGSGLETIGAVIPSSIAKNDISGLKWKSLVAYYSMNNFIGSTINDDSFNNFRGSLLSTNQVNFSQQTAPMPYQSVADGLWNSASTWANGSIQPLPNDASIVSASTKIVWNIVKTSHNINSNLGATLLALFVDSNTLSATVDSKIEVSHYLKLDGKIDLVGKSQLLQTAGSDLDETSSGSIERDQQGQSNIYNYNYWSSPVSSINSSQNNASFTVAEVMKDGTTSTPQDITWSPGIDGSPTSPITLASYWVFNFQELGGGVANWGAVGESGSLLPGQGFTLKGSGAATPKQNYTFVGKPNNGNITSTVSPNNLNLAGNPYPSSIDANLFIDDNASSIVGTLYFWEHFSTNNTHNTAQYQGGYATYTKTGGTAPVSVSGLGSSSRVPKRYIPVGQGFFVTGSATAGTITFRNNQRVFVKEDHARSNQLFRSTSNPAVADSDASGDDNPVDEQFIKLHLGFDSADNYHRQILLGFMNQYATSGYDNGYDGMSIEMLTNDMYFLNNETRWNIQGDGFFNTSNIYPLGIKNATAGIVKFGIDSSENLDESQDVFIYDNVTNEYHNIRTENFEIELPAGTYDSRFSLRFLNTNALGTNQNELQNNITVIHSQSNEMITIHNESLEVNVKSVSIYNLIGQNVTQWKLENQNQSNLQLPVNDLDSGAYIVKVNTDKGSTSKKIIIK